MYHTKLHRCLSCQLLICFSSLQAVKYSSSMDAARQIVAKEGSKSLFKGAGANILRGVAGAGVLSIYDQVQLILFGKKFK